MGREPIIPLSSEQPDANWDKVLQVLGDPAWDFRTLEGIVRTTQLSTQEVQDLLDSHKDVVRCTATWDNPGRLLYTLRSRRRAWREWAAAFQEYARIPYFPSQPSQ